MKIENGVDILFVNRMEIQNHINATIKGALH